MRYSLLPLFASLAAASLHTSPSRHSSLRRTSTCPPSKQIGAYWPEWSYAQPVAQVPYASLDLAFYFGIPTTADGVALSDGQSTSDITAFVTNAHAVGKTALVVIGGWSGSVYFSSSITSSAKRSKFAQSLAAFMNQYSFDGIDIDWEYVGKQGAGSNTVSPNDSANFLKFLAILRRTVGTRKILTASVPAMGFTGPDGKTLTANAGYALYLNYITVMAYDMYASGWSTTTGPNAPLASCAIESGSVRSSLAYWTSTGFPACQILLGVPSYSHISKTASVNLTATTCNGTHTFAFSPLAPTQPVDPTSSYADIIKNGWLSADGKTGMGGFTRHWDTCSSTPFLYAPSTQLFISYDDATSIGLKALYARRLGLAGINFYDSIGPDAGIFAAARAGLGGTFKPQKSNLKARQELTLDDEEAEDWGGLFESIDEE